MFKKSSKFFEKNACTFFDKMDYKNFNFLKNNMFRKKGMLLVHNLFYII